MEQAICPFLKLGLDLNLLSLSLSPGPPGVQSPEAEATLKNRAVLESCGSHQEVAGRATR